MIHKDEIPPEISLPPQQLEVSKREREQVNAPDDKACLQEKELAIATSTSMFAQQKASHSSRISPLLRNLLDDRSSPASVMHTFYSGGVQNQ